MATLTITLPDRLKAFAEAQAAREGYATIDEFLQAVLRQVEDRQWNREVEAKLLEAIEDGQSAPMTQEDWEAIERQGLEQLARERESRAS